MASIQPKIESHGDLNASTIQIPGSISGLRENYTTDSQPENNDDSQPSKPERKDAVISAYLGESNKPDDTENDTRGKSDFTPPIPDTKLPFDQQIGTPYPAHIVRQSPESFSEEIGDAAPSSNQGGEQGRLNPHAEIDGLWNDSNFAPPIPGIRETEQVQTTQYTVLPREDPLQLPTQEGQLVQLNEGGTGLVNQGNRGFDGIERYRTRKGTLIQTGSISITTREISEGNTAIIEDANQEDSSATPGKPPPQYDLGEETTSSQVGDNNGAPVVKNGTAATGERGDIEEEDPTDSSTSAGVNEFNGDVVVAGIESKIQQARKLGASTERERVEPQVEAAGNTPERVDSLKPEENGRSYNVVDGEIVLSDAKGDPAGGSPEVQASAEVKEDSGTPGDDGGRYIYASNIVQRPLTPTETDRGPEEPLTQVDLLNKNGHKISEYVGPVFAKKDNGYPGTPHYEGEDYVVSLTDGRQPRGSANVTETTTHAARTADMQDKLLVGFAATFGTLAVLGAVGLAVYEKVEGEI